MPQDIITLVILAVTVVMIVSLITDCVKDGHRTEERILIRKESMLKRKIEAKERKRAGKLPVQKTGREERTALSSATLGSRAQSNRMQTW